MNWEDAIINGEGDVWVGECERFRSDEGKWDGKSLIVSRRGRIQTRGGRRRGEGND